MPEPITKLRHAIETVRAQIPKGELTRASVERLLEAAEAVCAEEAERPVRPASVLSQRVSKRQEARARWAKIAQQNEKEDLQPSLAAE